MKKYYTRVTAAAVSVTVLILIGFIVYRNVHEQHPIRAGTTINALFIGNSFTSENDLPKTVAAIAQSLGNHLSYGTVAPGGYTFSQHAQDQTTLNQIQSKPWNFVVLQGQSQEPTFPDEQFARDVAPYAATLNERIHRNRASTKTVFFETWGYKNGDAMNCASIPGNCTYTGMQTRVNDGYELLAQQTSARLAPVGEAWSRVRRAHPTLELYQGDGIHPSPAGTYLAACVFYVTFFSQDVTGAEPEGLSRTDATLLQGIAQQTALDLGLYVSATR